MLNDNYVVYDIEVLRNVFTCVIETPDKRQEVYEISPRANDSQKFMERLHELQLNETYMVGFNNNGYDYPVLHTFIHNLYGLSAKEVTNGLYRKSQLIIKSNDRFEHTLWENNHFVKQIDLYVMNHFDNKAKHTSLKRLQFNMRLENIEEFELDFDKPIKKASDIDKLISYNRHDVHSTHEFLLKCKSAIAFREKLTNDSDKSYYNFNDTRIGGDYFLTRLGKEVGEHILYEYVDGRRIKRQTPRDVVPIKDIIFDNIHFSTPEFDRVLKRLKTFKMYVINGQFQWNEHDDYVEQSLRLEKWKADSKKRRKHMDKVDYQAEKS